MAAQTISSRMWSLNWTLTLWKHLEIQALIQHQRLGKNLQNGRWWRWVPSTFHVFFFFFFCRLRSDDGKHSEGFASAGVLQTGGRDKGVHRDHTNKSTSIVTIFFTGQPQWVLEYSGGEQKPEGESRTTHWNKRIKSVALVATNGPRTVVCQRLVVEVDYWPTGWF